MSSPKRNTSLTFALDAQTPDPSPSTTILDARLDDGQRNSASAVAGHDRLVVVVGPAGAGKTNMLEAAVADLHAPTPPRPRAGPDRTSCVGAESGDRERRVTRSPNCSTNSTIPTATVRGRSRRPGSTIIVDEAAMLNTADLYRLVVHAEERQWRLALVGDPHQLQAVGRGGMFNELCDTTRTVELEATPPLHPRLGSRHHPPPPSRRPHSTRHLRRARPHPRRQLRRPPRHDR